MVWMQLLLVHIVGVCGCPKRSRNRGAIHAYRGSNRSCHRCVLSTPPGGRSVSIHKRVPGNGKSADRRNWLGHTQCHCTSSLICCMSPSLKHVISLCLHGDIQLQFTVGIVRLIPLKIIAVVLQCAQLGCKCVRDALLFAMPVVVPSSQAINM